MSVGLPVLAFCHARTPLGLVVLGAWLTCATQVIASPLHEAAEDGDVALLGELIAQGADINEYGYPVGGPLHWAAAQGQIDAVAALLSHGADPNKLPTSVDANSALRLASEFGRLEVVRLLLDAGADPNIGEQEHRVLSLHKAAANDHADVVALLLDRGATLEAQDDSKKYTPLHETALWGSPEALAILVEDRANIDFIDGNGWSALHVATNFNQFKSVEKLVELGADLTALDKLVLTPLGLAMKMDHDDITAILKGAGAPE